MLAFYAIIVAACQAQPKLKPAVDGRPRERQAIRGLTRVDVAGPRAMNADRNLLFGILAFQNNFIDRQALLTAFDRWTSDKGKAIGELLVDARAISPDEFALLDGLVAKHLARHGNDPERSLAAVTPVGSLHDELSYIADHDVEASLMHVRQGPVVDGADGIPTISLGARSSTGLRFTVLRPHAKGGLGQVSVALDEELDREVAFKEIQDRHADNPDSRGRFLLEAKVTGGLEHPGIVPVYGLGSYADGRPFYAMRLIKGDSLKEAIKRFHLANAAGRDSTERTAELRQLLGRFIDVCNAIEYAHSRGVLHRDLKPGNIMLGNYGETLVVDWGLAKVLGRSETPSASSEPAMKTEISSGSAATEMGKALGTPQYMSPEQAAGRWDELGPATDVYSLGATLYTLLTGQAPIAEGESRDVLARAVKGDFPPPRIVDKEVPRTLDAICRKAMALKPTERYPSPRALADDIERWLNDQVVSVHRDPFSRRFARWRRNHKGTASAVAAALSVLVIGGLVASTMARRANERTLALAATDTLLNVSAAAVPLALDNLHPVGGLALGRLHDEFDDPQADPVRRLHAAYALADMGEAPQGFLLDAVATAPAGECRNLIAAFTHVKQTGVVELARHAESAAQSAARARYAIVALHLGEPRPAMDALALRSNPIHRTTLIHDYSHWRGSLGAVAEMLRTNEDAAFR
jgi:serine/threonine protein kinase